MPIHQATDRHWILFVRHATEELRMCSAIKKKRCSPWTASP